MYKDSITDNIMPCEGPRNVFCQHVCWGLLGWLGNCMWNFMHNIACCVLFGPVVN